MILKMSNSIEKTKKMKAQVRLMFVSLLLASLTALIAGKAAVKNYSFRELFSVGIEEAKNDKEEPYQFYTIANIDCDENGNIYVLDYQARHVKKYDYNGIFIKKFFRQGKGPNEVANPFSISINPYTDHIFILQDYGFTFKEFDMEGNYVKRHVLPRQFFGMFSFLDKDKFIYMNSVPKKDEYNNFHIVNIDQKKVIKEFSPIKMRHELNFKQYFDVKGNSILWTSRGNEMTLLAFDLQTGLKVQEIRIPGKYQENKLLETGKGNMKLVIPILYNVAQPFVIDHQLFTLVVLQEYREKNGKIDKFPIAWKRIIYQVNGSRFLKLGELEDSEGMYIGTVSKNRLILYSNEPYGRVRVLDFKKH